jgi:hypothetical protein
MKSLLCVGGPKDGQLFALQGNRMRVPVLKRTSPWASCSLDAIPTINYQEETYLRELVYVYDAVMYRDDPFIAEIWRHEECCPVFHAKLVCLGCEREIALVCRYQQTIRLDKRCPECDSVKGYCLRGYDFQASPPASEGDE